MKAGTASGLGHRVLAFTGVAMVIAFFMPWIDVLGHTVSGLELARDDAGGWKRHLLWLYPAGGAAMAYAGFTGASSLRGLALLVGGGVVGLAAYKTVGGMVEILRYGAWLTILASAAAIGSGAAKAGKGYGMIAGTLMIAGFFLPWLGQGAQAVSGHDLAAMSAAPDVLGLPSPKWLYLVPLFGGLAAAASLSPKARAGSIAGGFGALAVLAFLYIRTASFVLGWGAWITLIAGAVALLGGLLATARKLPAPRA